MVLDEKSVKKNPFDQFDLWFKDALKLDLVAACLLRLLSRLPPAHSPLSCRTEGSTRAVRAVRGRIHPASFNRRAAFVRVPSVCACL